MGWLKPERSEFKKLVVRYPIRACIGAGVLLSAVCMVAYRIHPALSLAIGAAFAFINWLAWRPGGFVGPKQRTIDDRPIDKNEIVKQVLLISVLTGLVFLAYSVAE